VNQGLSEMHRILRPGGCLVVLEFSKPAHPWFDRLFQFYFFRVLPRIGNAISGHDHAYTYLPASVRQFPNQQELVESTKDCGFEEVGFSNLSAGIAAIHYGKKRRVDRTRTSSNHFIIRSRSTAAAPPGSRDGYKVPLKHQNPRPSSWSAAVHRPLTTVSGIDPATPGRSCTKADCSEV
jgi:SAM-dependent methyltransferase